MPADGPDTRPGHLCGGGTEHLVPPGPVREPALCGLVPPAGTGGWVWRDPKCPLPACLLCLRAFAGGA